MRNGEARVLQVVPFSHAIRMICAWRGETFKSAAENCGLSRNTIGKYALNYGLPANISDFCAQLCGVLDYSFKHQQWLYECYMYSQQLLREYKNNPQALGSVVHRIRKFRNLTALQMAEILNVSISSYERLESGLYNASLPRLIRRELPNLLDLTEEETVLLRTASPDWAIDLIIDRPVPPKRRNLTLRPRVSKQATNAKSRAFNQSVAHYALPKPVEPINPRVRGEFGRWVDKQANRLGLSTTEIAQIGRMTLLQTEELFEGRFWPLASQRGRIIRGLGHEPAVVMKELAEEFANSK